jgi:hypothetical protein
VRDPSKRVVITGIGCCSVHGNDPDKFYEKWVPGPRATAHWSADEQRVNHQLPIVCSSNGTALAGSRDAPVWSLCCCLAVAAHQVACMYLYLEVSQNASCAVCCVVQVVGGCQRC